MVLKSHTPDTVEAKAASLLSAPSLVDKVTQGAFKTKVRIFCTEPESMLWTRFQSIAA